MSNKEFYMEFANWMKDRRITLCLSQAELAAKIGVVRQTIATAERGERIKPLTMRRIKNALRMPRKRNKTPVLDGDSPG